MPERDGAAAVIEPGSPQERLRVPDNATLPAGDFTIEAFVDAALDLFADATVRTIVSQWDGNNEHPGWSLGVTSEKSKHKPRNLILQLAGDSIQRRRAVRSARLRPAPGAEQAVLRGRSVRIADTSEAGVTFYLQDLTDDKPTASVSVVARGDGPLPRAAGR